MEQHELGRTGRQVSGAGLGTWQLGADWGDVSEADARAVLEASAEEGVTFFDTADVYGDGRSEQHVGRFLAAHPDEGIVVATKMGRRAPGRGGRPRHKEGRGGGAGAGALRAAHLRGVARPSPPQPRRRAPGPG